VNRTILSLFDFTGAWSAPYREAGYHVIQVDIKGGKYLSTPEGVTLLKDDVRLLRFIDLGDHPVHGILIAPPCTAFAVSGAQYWTAKDVSGETLVSLALVDAGLRAVAIYRPVWWALENPVGRLRHWLGPPRHIFNPCDYGDPYTKKTLLWGEFLLPVRCPVKPDRVCSQGSWVQKLGGRSERTKELRSATPSGFSKAFFEANP
jgi:hypothetical protein